MSTTYAVIGASRGIGLELVRQLAARPETTVFVTVRSLGAANYLLDAIEGLPNVHVFEADVKDYPALERAAKQVSAITGGTLDCLIYNAARVTGGTFSFGYEEFSSVEALDEEFIESFRVNTLGMIHSIKTFLPLLRESTVSVKKILVVNSIGSDPKTVLRVSHGGTVACDSTKAATLTATAKWAVTLKKDNIAVVSVHPGLVNTQGTRGDGEGGISESDDHFEKVAEILTGMGIPTEVLTPAQSAAAQIQIIDELTVEKTGLFLKYTGEEWELR